MMRTVSVQETPFNDPSPSAYGTNPTAICQRVPGGIPRLNPGRSACNASFAPADRTV